MMVHFNGQLIPEEQASISVFDRSFLYGDGLFETLHISGGKLFRCAQHLQRLRQGAAFLRMTLPFTDSALTSSAGELILANGVQEGLLRITLSRGVGPRGYSPKGAGQPVLIMTVHHGPSLPPDQVPQWHLVVSIFHLPANEPLANFKTCNKLPQILARAEAEDAGADEALLLNTGGFIVEAASSNLFWLQNDAVLTPPLNSGILQGVTRAVVLDLCGKLGIPSREINITPDELARTDGVFMSLSSLGVVEGVSLDGKPLARSPLTKSLWAAYQKLVRDEAESERGTSRPAAVIEP